MCNEITEEERERIVSELKACPSFTDCYLATVFFPNEDCADTDCVRCRDTFREKLIALIESAPTQQECIPWPLDADGVPCKIDDVVYYKDEAIYIEYCDSKFVVYSDEKGYLHELYASEVTHNEPRTLEDIKNDALYSGLTSDSESLVLSLIDEAYELGRKAAENERD